MRSRGASTHRLRRQGCALQFKAAGHRWDASLTAWPATGRSQTWQRGCRGSSKRATTPSGCTRRPVAAHPTNSKPNSLSRRLGSDDPGGPIDGVHSNPGSEIGAIRQLLGRERVLWLYRPRRVRMLTAHCSAAGYTAQLNGRATSSRSTASKGTVPLRTLFGFSNSIHPSLKPSSI